MQTIVKNNLDEIEDITVGGDLNCPLNPVIVKRGGSMIARQSVITVIEQLQSDLDLYDLHRTDTYICSIFVSLVRARVDLD